MPTLQNGKPKLLELFSGIGAVAAACEGIDVVGAIDISQLAAHVYQANFASPNLVREISTISDHALGEFDADVWWMSPPCQPFTRRGLRADIHDPRCQALLHITDAITRVRPTIVAMENVHGFESSKAFARMKNALSSANYRIATEKLCSTQFGIPNLRPRFFLVATQIGKPSLTPPPTIPPQPLALFLDTARQDRNPDDLCVSESLLNKYSHAVSIVTPPEKLSRCFTSAYGQSIVRSGSYLKTEQGYRRFSPTEVARLLGFPADFVLPEGLETRQLWKLLGNSLSIPCVKFVLHKVERLLATASERTKT